MDTPNQQGTGYTPALLKHIANWKLHRRWSMTLPTFSDQWSPDTTFPAGDDSFDLGRFLVRWRVVDTGTRVASGWVGDGISSKVMQGTHGWMDLDACERPQFKYLAIPTALGNMVHVAEDVEWLVPSS